MSVSTGARRGLTAIAVAGAVMGPAAAAADAAPRAFKQATGLDYVTCADPDAVADGFKCATVTVPKNYADARDGTLKLAVTVRPATDTSKPSLGPLFVNYGGPGGDAVSTTQAAGTRIFSKAITDRFDLAAIDPRGVGESSPSIDCRANQLTQGIYSQPVPTPRTIDPAAFTAKVRAYVQQCVRLNRGVLPYVSTANVARDMDYVRQLLGAKKLNYFGFSYGTFLGATYASLFPRNYRAAVLDGALDAKDYISRPHEDLLEQTAGFERALGRYWQASQRDLAYSRWIVDGDAQQSYDDLVGRADASPIPAPNTARVGDGSQTSTQPVTGDEINSAVSGALYNKALWPNITVALNAAAAGDGSIVRYLNDRGAGKLPDGSFDPGTDRYFTIGAVEQRKPTGGLQRVLDAGESAWKTFDHFSYNVGYVEENYRQFPIRGVGVYQGPFDVPANAKAPLVVGTTYDPATTYRQAVRLVDDLGNAKLLTMKGDGHTAYGNGSACADKAIERYLLTSRAPATDPMCVQDGIPFPPAPNATLQAPSETDGLVPDPLRPTGRGF